MPAKKRAARDRLFTTRWVHAFEEDTEDGAVYRPDDHPLPLSRRPREQLEVRPDGSARLFVPGPDDRSAERSATWQDQDGEIVVQAKTGDATLRIVEQSPSRLVVKTGTSRKRR